MTPTATMTEAPPTISQDLEAGECYEIINGIRVEIPPMSAESAVIASRLSFHLNTFGFTNAIGESVVEGLFHLPLPTDRNRRPDVAFIPFNRWPQNKRVPSTNAWDVLPDIVVEVISPTDEVEIVLDKIEEYFLSGIRLVWMIFPKQQLVYVYETPHQIRVLTRNDSLDGGVALPGFQLPLKQLFLSDE